MNEQEFYRVDKNLPDISEAMRDIDFCMLATRAANGGIAARPMSNNREVEYEGTSWFFTCDHHTIVADIEREPAVGLSFQGKAGLKGLVGAPGMFIHVEGREALQLIPAYEPCVHAFLLDSGRPNAPVAELGGTGRAHDWAVSAAFVRATEKPVFLAGGLTAANVAEAIGQVRPYGVDLCSGVRTGGQLDPQKLFAFVTAVQQIDREMARAM